MRQGVPTEFLDLASRPAAVRPRLSERQTLRPSADRAETFEPQHEPRPEPRREPKGRVEARQEAHKAARKGAHREAREDVRGSREPRERAAPDKARPTRETAPARDKKPAREEGCKPPSENDHTTDAADTRPDQPTADASAAEPAPASPVEDAVVVDCEPKATDATQAGSADAAADSAATDASDQAAAVETLLAAVKADTAEEPKEGLALALGLKAGPANPEHTGDHHGLARALGRIEGVGRGKGPAAAAPVVVGAGAGAEAGQQAEGVEAAAQPAGGAQRQAFSGALGSATAKPANAEAALQKSEAVSLPVDIAKADAAAPAPLGHNGIQGAAAQTEGHAAASTEGAREARHPVVHDVPLGAVPIEIGLRAMAGTRRFDIRLDPAELGRVDVRLDMSEDGEVKATLTVDKVETLALLQRDARTLERAFEQAGLKPSDGGVDLMLRDQTLAGGNRQQDRQPQDGERTPAVAAPTNEAVDQSGTRVLWRGHTGLDLRV